MKKTVAICTLVLVTSAVAYVAADIDSAITPEKGMLVGTAIEISTYATQGITDVEIPAMASRCEQGFPVGILEEATGEVWVVVFRNNAPASALETGNKQLQPLIGKKVSAQGLKYRAKGINVMRLAVVSEY